MASQKAACPVQPAVFCYGAGQKLNLRSILDIPARGASKCILIHAHLRGGWNCAPASDSKDEMFAFDPLSNSRPNAQRMHRHVRRSEFASMRSS